MVSKMSEVSAETADVVIRQAEREDAETVFLLIRSLAESHRGKAGFLATLEDVRRDGFGKKPLYESWLAETEGNPAGVATFFMTYSTFKGSPCPHLDNLSVNEGGRRFGIAQRLILRICRRAVELNCWRMDLHVEKDNQARAFYEKIGLSETSDRVYAVWNKKLKELAQKDLGTFLPKKVK